MVVFSFYTPNIILWHIYSSALVALLLFFWGLFSLLFANLAFFWSPLGTQAMSFWRHQSYLFFQETGEFVGTVGNVYNSGASDLLHVKLDSSLNVLDKTGKPRTAEMVASDHFVWVPFVEAIVPNVDMDRKEIQITPPKGLLELNLRFDERSKKERRQLVRHTHLYYTTYGLKLLFDINFLQRLYTCMLYVIYMLFYWTFLFEGLGI